MSGTKKEKFMVTSALPYANGPIHLGHIAGAYLPGDIFTRFNRLIGNDVLFICGTDEHGVPITIRAEAEGVTPRTIVKRYHADIKKSFDRMNIVFDNFSGTSNVHNKYHAQLSREFFIKLHKNKFISSHIEDQFFSDRFLPDRYVVGTCPKCGNPEARGDECPICNAQYSPLELKNPICKLTGKTPELKSTKHWYLKLDALQKELEYWIETKDYWKENVVNFIKGWFKDGLKERAITRDLHWGVPVPFDDAAGKVLYVWFDAPIGYISSTMQWAEKQGDIEKWREYWQNPDCKIVHFIGKDNIPFHAIIWPAMLAGQRENYELPWHVPANEYLNFGLSHGQKSKDGQEMVKASTTKGNVIWVHDCLDVFDADYIRYFLAACAPEKNDTLFTWKDFQSKCNTELLGVIGNLANRVLKFIESNFSSTIPEAKNLSQQDQDFLKQIQEAPKKIKQAFANFEVRRAVHEIAELARSGNQYLNEKAPWKSVKTDLQDCQNCMFVSSQLIHAVVVMLSPVIPDSSRKLWQQLGCQGNIDDWNYLKKGIPAGQKIGTPEGIFQRIEDKVIAEMEEKLTKALGETSESSEASESDTKTKEPEIPPFKEEQISYDDFAKLDIRIGQVLEAQKVPKANKLLQLKVQIGNQTRQIIAGIAQHYKPEDLIGKKVPVLANLKPAKIRGLVSEGMILCPDTEGNPMLMHPEKDIPTGSVVR